MIVSCNANVLTTLTPNVWYIYNHPGITSCYCRGAPYFVSNVPVRVNVLQVEDNCNCASTNEYLSTKECSRGSLVQFTSLLSFGTNNYGTMST